MSEYADCYDLIKLNYTTLVKEIDAEFLLDYLYQGDVVDVHDMERVRNISRNNCKKDGAIELVKILRLNGPRAVSAFLSILPRVGYTSLAERLKESQKRPHPEPTSVVLQNHSNRIQQLEQQVAALSSENQEMKAQMKAMKPNQAANSKNQTKSNTDNMNKKNAKDEKQLQLERYEARKASWVRLMHRKMYRKVQMELFGLSLRDEQN